MLEILAIIIPHDVLEKTVLRYPSVCSKIEIDPALERYY